MLGDKKMWAKPDEPNRNEDAEMEKQEKMTPEMLSSGKRHTLKLKFSQYPSIHTNYIITHCTTL